MKVGDYVRTNYGIAKITNISFGEELEFDNYEVFGEWKDMYKNNVFNMNSNSDMELIIKSNPNIIDLIGKDDLVVDNYGNIYVVDYVFDNYVYTTTKQGNIIKTLCDYQIKSIVTHEQFESMEYKL